MFRRFGGFLWLGRCFACLGAERVVAVRVAFRRFGGGAGGGGLGRLFLTGGGGGEKFFCKNGLKTIDIVS